MKGTLKASGNYSFTVAVVVSDRYGGSDIGRVICNMNVNDNPDNNANTNNNDNNNANTDNGNTDNGNTGTTSSSSEGCNSLHALAIILAAVLTIRKSRR